MESRHHKLFWGSSYDRGLDIILFMWSDIKKEFPDAEIHICYGWKLFDSMARTNPERRQWKASVETLMEQPGVIHHGRVGKSELQKIRKSCGIWAYPTYFTEINCITALDCMQDGVVPVTMTLAALDEIVGAGVKVEGKIRDPKVQKEYLKELLEMMRDRKKWRREIIKGKKYAKQFSWSNISKEWAKEFQKPISTPRVTVITPTIREGFWNLMSHNLSLQSYTNFEWIIVDDHPEDRSKIAKKYADLYDLDIRYLRGEKGSSYPRRCGLVRANNIAWKAAKGELLVWLQDFVLLPFNGLETLVNFYRHHPNDLIAPVDIYYDALPADKKNKEDWWKGMVNIITQKAWTNIRVKYEGVRYTDNPYNFELDCGAIPKKVLDRLNGFWEFMDDGLGFDNTEIAYRALMTGSRVVLDDSLVVKCINIWPVVGGTSQNVLHRDRMLNPPRWAWMRRQLMSGKLPYVRDIKRDAEIHLDFEIPEDVTDEKCNRWIKKHTKELVKKWEEGEADAVQVKKTKKVYVRKTPIDSKKVGKKVRSEDRS